MLIYGSQPLLKHIKKKKSGERTSGRGNKEKEEKDGLPSG